MVEEERYIKKRFGKSNNFRVPDGYFDNFASTMISKLPQQAPVVVRQRPRMRILRPIIYSAACLCLAIFGVTIYLSDTSRNVGNNTLSKSVKYSNVYTYTTEDAIIDHAMMDNADMYTCLINE